jgi:hypothetical protein
MHTEQQTHTATLMGSSRTELARTMEVMGQGLRSCTGMAQYTAAHTHSTSGHTTAQSTSSQRLRPSETSLRGQLGGATHNTSTHQHYTHRQHRRAHTHTGCSLGQQRQAREGQPQHRQPSHPTQQALGQQLEGRQLHSTSLNTHQHQQPHTPHGVGG